MKRTNYCVDTKDVALGDIVTVSGWIAKERNLGGVLFADVRDRTGIVQCVFNEEDNAELFQKSTVLRTEFVVSITGKVRERSSKNPNIPTGNIEIEATDIEIHSKADTTPFEITDEKEVNDALRLKYRYLDLRRPSLQKSMALRHKVTQITRNYFDENGFLEIETPMLTKSTPEGARDYLVPSRVHNGKFYALPQSPQQYKQLLMLSGFDRYMQITRCFRDEDLRADRQPEFTQIDLEMSFVDQDDVMAVNEGFLKTVFKKVHNVDIELPLPRMPYSEAMERFGSDKPDTRFGFELKDITEEMKNTEFKVFREALDNNGVIKFINVNGGAKFTRKEIDSLVEYVKTYRAKGLAWIKMTDGNMSSSFAKFMTEDEMSAILAKADAKDGDLILVCSSDNADIVYNSLGALRCEVAKRMGILDEKQINLLWVTDFPLFEYDEELGRYFAKHHPFTAPFDEDLEKLESNPGEVRAKAYDIIMNGVELGGGSIRIHKPDVQETMFKALGFTSESANAQFGHLIEAFKYGAPPHGGLAYGLDRLCMLLSGRDSIRDVIAFPKVQNASELMTNAPDVVEQSQLDELGIGVVAEEISAE
ncbi:MAG: aspartate--tRNA ligase [Clostridia bacterium]